MTRFEGHSWCESNTELAEQVPDLVTEVVVAGVMEGLIEAVDVRPEVDDVVDSGPVVVRILAVLEVVVGLVVGVRPALPELGVPLEGVGHGWVEAVDVLLVLVQVDHAELPEVVPAEGLPEAESVCIRW